MFGNPLYRGVVFRWNRWSDIRGGTHNGAAGIRLDDMISDVVIHGNLFERCGAVIFGGVQIHGGKDNLVDGNLFLDCFAGVSFSRWGDKRWLEAIAGFLPQAGQPPYATPGVPFQPPGEAMTSGRPQPAPRPTTHDQPPTLIRAVRSAGSWRRRSGPR